MKKLGQLFKETSENLIKNTLKESESVFIINYTKLSSPDLSLLRESLKHVKARLLVVKNSVARRALKTAGLEELLKKIEGPCGMIFIKEELVNVSKLLCGFSKEHEHLKLEAGFLKDRILEKKDIEALARIPSREVLRAQVVTALKAPITGVVMVLHQTLQKFVYCLEQIKNKKIAS